MRSNHTFMRMALGSICCLLLAACGSRGPLTLPPKDASKAAAPAQTSAQAKPAPDNNSTPVTPRQ